MYCMYSKMVGCSDCSCDGFSCVSTDTILQLSDDRGTVRRLESENWIDDENKIVLLFVVIQCQLIFFTLYCCGIVGEKNTMSPI